MPQRTLCPQPPVHALAPRPRRADAVSLTTDVTCQPMFAAQNACPPPDSATPPPSRLHATYMPHLAGAAPIPPRPARPHSSCRRRPESDVRRGSAGPRAELPRPAKPAVSSDARASRRSATSGSRSGRCRRAAAERPSAAARANRYYRRRRYAAPGPARPAGPGGRGPPVAAQAGGGAGSGQPVRFHVTAYGYRYS